MKKEGQIGHIKKILVSNYNEKEIEVRAKCVKVFRLNGENTIEYKPLPEEFNRIYGKTKTFLNKKQIKLRKLSKIAKKSRKINHKIKK